MFKRVTWFTIGTAVGVAGTVVGYLRARDIARRHVPDTVSEAAQRAAQLADSGVRVAVDRSRARAEEIRANLETTQRTRRRAEDLLERELDRAGL